MCLGSFWTALQLLWSSVYVFCGATQLVTGIFFLISVPALHFTSNLVVGFVNIIMGIIGGALVCFGKLSPRRQEALLYLSCSILSINIAAAILREWGLYFEDFQELLKDHPYHLLILYGCFAARIAAAAVIVASFLDSQFAFCSMQIRSKDHTAVTKKIKTGKRQHDNLADIEYIIPRQKPSKSPSKPHAIYNAYAQSWVFEADQATGSSNLAACTKIVQNGSPRKQPSQLNGGQNYNHTTSVSDSTRLIENPVVQIEEASDDSTSNSDRKLGHMKSFSRATSPILLSASSSQLSLSLNQANKPQIYEYLEKLTEPEVYRSRLNTALSDREENESAGRQTTIAMQRVESISPRSEKVQYACFMQELQKAIVNKKETISPQSTSGSISVSDKTQTNSKCSSRQESSRSDAKSSDGDFSRELEAALQLIQDLETPSEGKSLGDFKEQTKTIALWRSSNASSEDSDKTQTGIGSIGELTSPLSDRQPELRTFKPPTTGKGASIIVHHPNSQSTSGYSSPTHPASSTSVTPQNWSTTSSINGSNNEIIQPVSYSIHNSKCTTVISLYTPNGTNQKGKSVTLVSITGDNDPVSPLTRVENSTTVCNIDKDLVPPRGPELGQKDLVGTTPTRTYGSNGWRSLLRKKRHAPKLCPELEGAIIKSESLAYLSEVELLARHQRNNEMHRKIEERVIQQLGVPRTESKC